MRCGGHDVISVQETANHHAEPIGAVKQAGFGVKKGEMPLTLTSPSAIVMLLIPVYNPLCEALCKSYAEPLLLETYELPTVYDRKNHTPDTTRVCPRWMWFKSPIRIIVEDGHRVLERLHRA